MATLPTQYTVPPYSLPVGGTVYQPTDGPQFQTALTNCVGGDVIILDKDIEYVTPTNAPFVLPAKDTSSKWIYIISSDVASLPEGTRVSPADSVHMARLAAYASWSNTLSIRFGAQKVRLVGLNISTNHTSLDNTQYGLLRIGDKSFDGPLPEGGAATDIIIDRCIVAGNDGASRDGIVMYSVAGGAVVNSCIRNFYGAGMETHGIHIPASPGPIFIDNNFIEASSINFFAGDTFATYDSAGNPLYVYDLTFTNNHCYKRPEWEFDTPIWTGVRSILKNLWETKGVQRCLVEGNVFENSYPSGGQFGTCFTVKTNCGPVLDFVARNNPIINTYQVAGLHKQPYAGADPKPSAENLATWNKYWPPDEDRTLEMERIVFTNNLSIHGRLVGGLTVYSIGGGITDLTLTFNTSVLDSATGGIAFYMGAQSPQVLSGTISDNILAYGEYGLWTSGMAGGKPTYDMCLPGILYENNLLVQNVTTGLADTHIGDYGPFHFPVGFEGVGFVNLAGDDPLDYALAADSNYKGVGTGGSDPGCNVQAVYDAIVDVVVPTISVTAAKFTHSSVLDAALNEIKSNAVIMAACSSLPSTYTEAISTYKLADVAIDSSDFTGPQNGGTADGARKVAVMAQDAIQVDKSGTATHTVICSNNTLLHAATCVSIVLTAGQTVSFQSWDIEFAPPTA